MRKQSSDFQQSREGPALASETQTAPRFAPLAARRLSVGYSGRPIIRDVDFTASEGRVNVLLGPNGCGKSTLLRALARVAEPMAGEVLLDGRPVHSMNTAHVARRLAYLPQRPSEPEGLTVEALVAQGRFPYQSLFNQWSTQDRDAVDSAMAATGVFEFRRRRLDTLSGGQLQRCWIAMIMAQDSGIILLDEPTSFLDLKVQIDLMEMLHRIAHEEGRTLIVVLHELNLAAAFADRLVMMRDGQVIADGSVERVFTEENLHRAFGLDAAVVRDDVNGRPVCIPRVCGPTKAIQCA